MSRATRTSRRTWLAAAGGLAVAGLLPALTLLGCVVEELGHEEGADCNPQQLCEPGLVCVRGTCRASQGGAGEDPGSLLRVLKRERGPALGIDQPRGLAHDGEALWTSDEVTKELVRLSPEPGEVLGRWPLQRHAVVGLAWVEHGLYVGFDQLAAGAGVEPLAAQVLRLEGLAPEGTPEDTGVALEALAGLCAAGDGLVTLEGSNLGVRSVPSLSAGRVLVAEAEGAPLVRLGGLYLLYAGSRADVEGVFAATFEVLDADNTALASWLGEATLAVDVGVVTGLAEHGGDLWLLGAGYGGDAGHPLRLTLERSAGGAP